MIDISKLKLELANNFGDIGQIKIEYLDDKPEFTGYLSKIHEDTLDFTIMKMTTHRNENRYSLLDFENIKKITLTYQGSTDSKIFE